MRTARIIAITVVVAFAAGFLPGLIGRAFTPSAEPVHVPSSPAPEGDTAMPPVDVMAHTRQVAADTWRTATEHRRDQLCAGAHPASAGPLINWPTFEHEIDIRCATR